MADRSLEGMALPLEVRARLAELELELSEAIGCQKLIELNDEHKLCIFCEKHMDTEVAADALGEE